MSLTHDGNDLAADLISQGLVTSDSNETTNTDYKETIKTDSPLFERNINIFNTLAQKIIFSVVAIDKTLLPGQVLVAKAPFILGVHKFCIHLIPDAISKVESLIADYVAKGVCESFYQLIFYFSLL